MLRKTVTDNRTVITVNDTVTIQITIFRHTRLCIGFRSVVRHVRLQRIGIARLVKILVLIGSFIDITVHGAHRLTNLSNVTAL